MKLVLILLISILLVGCSEFEELLPEKKEEPKPPPKEQPKEVIKEKIVYIDRNITVTEPCNITCPDIKYNYTGSTSRELELIRRLKWFEKQQSKYFNDTECRDNLNKTSIRLEECEQVLCDDWNVSWC